MGPAEDITLTRDAGPLSGRRSASANGDDSALFSGKRLAHFEVLELVGSGGFGEVYRARDTRLDRIVAIKILPQAFAVDAERRERFRREAIAASALNHPHACTVHDLVEADGHFLIVMELVEGQTLHERLKAGPLPVAEALPIAIQIADALGEAHRAGILHRDVKCRNIALTKRGQAKVLDFGLAKPLDFGTQPDAQTLEKLTADGSSPGTPGYMSPEQLLAMPLDARSDLFSFGVVLYRMVTGRLPFEGTSGMALANATLHSEPRGFGDASIPEKLKGIVSKLLRKEPEKRYASAEDVEAELKTLEAEASPARRSGLSRTAWAALAAGLLLVVSAGGWYAHRWSRERWALKATDEITRLLEAEEFPKAAALIQEARAILPKDPTLEKLWMKATGEASIESEPAGAEVSFRLYHGDTNAWESLGKTPLKKVRVAGGFYAWRIDKPGFAMHEFLSGANLNTKLRLRPRGEVPPEMVQVLGRETFPRLSGLAEAPSVRLDDFLIDRHEVTNEEYRTFVDAGGYDRPEFWGEAFVEGGRTLPREEAMARFRDSTGRPGPATWEVGRFPKGLEKHPVAGVSWYEAAAYAAFARKSLPTIYHWGLAAQTPQAVFVVRGSNFTEAGTVPVGRPGAVSGSGTSDMAGNVKEWCLNEGPDGKRYLLGGGFGEATYMFQEPDAQSPWERRPTCGFRCVKLVVPAPAEATAKIVPGFRDLTKVKPVSDEVFAAFMGLYAYDKGPLEARLEETETADDWTRQKVSFLTAYGGERMCAHLFLPKGVAPPLQTVVYFPGSGVRGVTAFEPWRGHVAADSPYVDALVKSGRAVVYPIYKGTFERSDVLEYEKNGDLPAWRRDQMIMWVKDLNRSVDYLETRKEFALEKLAYFGFSWGVEVAPVALAGESRFRAAVLVAGGLNTGPNLPEVDAINFVTRVKIPVLIVNGRYDLFAPMEKSQLLLLHRLGTADKDKRLAVFEAGHVPPMKEVVRESLAWLDRYLGPVKAKPGAGM